MNPETAKVAEHMREFGCYGAGRAICQAVFSEVATPYSHAICVTLAAQAAELLIKSRIVQEHPLLIFSTLPKSTTTEGLLGISELFEHGRTLEYNELPEKLWATTGYRMKNIKQFTDFGKLRNQIIHFAVPDRELSDITLQFAFEFLDVLVEDLWNDTLVSYAVTYDDVLLDSYLQERLTQLNIKATDNTRDYIKAHEAL